MCPCSTQIFGNASAQIRIAGSAVDQDKARSTVIDHSIFSINKIFDLRCAGYTEEDDIARGGKFSQRGRFSGALAEKIFERGPVAVHERLQGISAKPGTPSPPSATVMPFWVTASRPAPGK